MSNTPLLPICRRIYAKTIAFDLVSVVPMSDIMTEKEKLELQRKIEIDNRRKKIDKIINRIKKGNN